MVLRGPAAQIAFDGDANPTRAAQGFARSKGIDVEDLKVQEMDGRDYVVAEIAEQGRSSAQVLAEVLPEVIGSLNFGKSMRWNESGVSFSRPLRWYVALLQEVVVPFSYAGILSGRVTRGIRPVGSPDLEIASAGDYAETIARAGIMLDVEQRKAHILSEARALAAQEGGEIPEDDDLLNEVANLVEYPLLILGRFDPAYLKLPASVLLAVMRKHQRYLPVMRGEEMLPCFVAVANGSDLDQDLVRHGNEEVLRARYADAAFFYEADTRYSLDHFTSRLSTLTFEEHLGSVLDKVGRIETVVPALGERLGLSQDGLEAARRAAALCKSDLATNMVVELTSLQGVMGRHYALASGEPPEVAQAIEEHYLPRYVGDRFPESPVGLALGLADRLDTLVGLFAVGVKPTGAADPWGLRRAALGVLQLLLERGDAFSLSGACEIVAKSMPVEVGEEVIAEVVRFIAVRLEALLRDEGVAYDVVNAVLAEQADDPVRASVGVQMLSAATRRGDWTELLDSYARCVRITRDVQETLDPPSEEDLQEASAKTLLRGYRTAAELVAASPTVDGLVEAITALRPSITRFFDDVLVMDPDPRVRRNRLALLQAIAGLGDGLADLSQMEGF